jgi:hypothetical protein
MGGVRVRSFATRFHDFRDHETAPQDEGGIINGNDPHPEEWLSHWYNAQAASRRMAYRVAPTRGAVL